MLECQKGEKNAEKPHKNVRESHLKEWINREKVFLSLVKESSQKRGELESLKLTGIS